MTFRDSLPTSARSSIQAPAPEAVEPRGRIIADHHETLFVVWHAVEQLAVRHQIAADSRVVPVDAQPDLVLRQSLSLPKTQSDRDLVIERRVSTCMQERTAVEALTAEREMDDHPRSKQGAATAERIDERA